MPLFFAFILSLWNAKSFKILRHVANNYYPRSFFLYFVFVLSAKKYSRKKNLLLDAKFHKCNFNKKHFAENGNCSLTGMIIVGNILLLKQTIILIPTTYHNIVKLNYNMALTHSSLIDWDLFLLFFLLFVESWLQLSNRLLFTFSVTCDHNFLRSFLFGSFRLTRLPYFHCLLLHLFI